MLKTVEAACSVSSLTVVMSENGTLIGGCAAISTLAPVVASVALAVRPPARTTLTGLSVRIDATWSHATVTAPNWSVFTIRLFPSFLMTAPVTRSPFLSTTWSARSEPESMMARKRRAKVPKSLMSLINSDFLWVLPSALCSNSLEYGKYRQRLFLPGDDLVFDLVVDSGAEESFCREVRSSLGTGVP